MENWDQSKKKIVNKIELKYIENYIFQRYLLKVSMNTKFLQVTNMPKAYSKLEPFTEYSVPML